METTEKRFEQDIEHYLLTEGGYQKGSMATFDPKRAIDMTTLVSFIRKTQEKEWNKLVKYYGDKAEERLYQVFQDNVARYGIIHVLRNELKDIHAKFRVCYFAPASNLNTALTEKYRANILTCTRQFAYSASNRNTIDMVLSLNGIPLVALELKNQQTGQCAEDAMRQFMRDRDPKELIFNLNSRIIAYFAVDLFEAWMATELRGADTLFLPFNQGSNGAGKVGDAGNPANVEGYTTSYLWERVLRRDMLLSILQRYVSKQVEEKIRLKDGRQRKSTSSKIIFPRYHQLDVVEKLIADTRAKGSGQYYLIQHSAGSGKSNSIAWLTYRLSTLHDELDEGIFRTVFVVTDRRVLNKQLQETILGFDHVEGQVETITDKDSSQKLKEAINDGKRIIVTTLHRFPIIYKELDKHEGKRFAIIVDEAHSSQSGKSAEKLKAALADTSVLEDEAAEYGMRREEDDDTTGLDQIIETISTHGRHENLSFYAFTATPKPKTLEIFGERQPDGSFDAFHHYSMRQAIGEDFIKDVLKFYTTIETAYKIVKTIQNDPTLEEPPATKAIKAYHNNHKAVVEGKVAIMVEKFREITLTKIGGRAKAMVVSPSRAMAVRYFFAIKDYCRKMGYDDVKPLVAFSGTVNHKDRDWTEQQLNSTDEVHISEQQLPLYFGSDMYNMLIVADKYQTGFDEPLLHTMFIDKKLRGVKAVQTLSRVNRCCRGKIDTYILDFANNEQEIQDAFKPFYEDTTLKEAVDGNLVYTLKTDLENYHLWTSEDEDKVFDIYKKKKQGSRDHGQLQSILKVVVDRVKTLPEEEQAKVRSTLKSFNRIYAYLAQVVRIWDAGLYKSYIFTEFLYKVLPRTRHEVVDLEGKISLVANKFTEAFSGSISLSPTPKDKTLEPEKVRGGSAPVKKFDVLTNIIEKINLMYQGQFSEADRVIVEALYDKMLKSSKVLKKQARKTSAEMFETSIFPQEFNRVAQDCYTQQMDAFEKLFQNEQFYQRVMQEMAKAMYANFNE